jgi:hypothetical protein
MNGVGRVRFAAGVTCPISQDASKSDIVSRNKCRDGPGDSLMKQKVANLKFTSNHSNPT